MRSYSISVVVPLHRPTSSSPSSFPHMMMFLTGYADFDERNEIVRSQFSLCSISTPQSYLISQRCSLFWYVQSYYNTTTHTIVVTTVHDAPCSSSISAKTVVEQILQFTTLILKDHYFVVMTPIFFFIFFLIIAFLDDGFASVRANNIHFRASSQALALSA